MAANTAPVFSKAGDVQWGSAALTAANTAKDGTGTVQTVFTADATNGGWIDYLRICPIGTNIGTVMRIFINNGSSNATPANNTLFTEMPLPASTLIETDGMGFFDVRMELALPAGYKVNVVLGTAVAAGYQVTAVAGKY